MDNPKITYYDNGQKASEQWLVDGALHHIDGPASQLWTKNGTNYEKIWFIDGKQHRLYGPAYFRWNIDKQKYEEEWFVNGVDKTKEIIKWIKKYKILLDENSCIVNQNDKMIFKLKFGGQG